MDKREIKVRFPAGEIFFASPKLQDGLRRPPSPLMGTESSLPREKRRSHKADHSAPPTAEVKNNCNYISTPAIRHHGVQRDRFTHLCLHS
jgi:hypothetical protein